MQSEIQIVLVLCLVVHRSSTSELVISSGTNELTQPSHNENITEDFAATTIITTTVEPITSDSTSPRCPWECKYGKCGKLLASMKKIVGGKRAKAFSWPWIGSIWANDTLLCGATLICQSWVITAAHCFLEATGRRVDLQLPRDLYLGRYLKQGNYKAVKKIHLAPDLIKIHPHYDISKTYNDIALIRLPKPVKISRRIFPVCLPTVGTQPPNIGDKCRVAGWGKTMGIGPKNRKLKEANVPLVSANVCKFTYYFSKTDQILCAGGGKDDPCAGDSGGPLLCESPSNPGKWEIQGIITYGASNCGTAKLPGIYAKVRYYLKWIHEVLDNECVMWRFLNR